MLGKLKGLEGEKGKTQKAGERERELKGQGRLALNRSHHPGIVYTHDAWKSTMISPVPEMTRLLKSSTSCTSKMCSDHRTAVVCMGAISGRRSCDEHTGLTVCESTLVVIDMSADRVMMTARSSCLWAIVILFKK